MGAWLRLITPRVWLRSSPLCSLTAPSPRARLLLFLSTLSPPSTWLTPSTPPSTTLSTPPLLSLTPFTPLPSLLTPFTPPPLTTPKCPHPSHSRPRGLSKTAIQQPHTLDMFQKQTKLCLKDRNLRPYLFLFIF